MFGQKASFGGNAFGSNATSTASGFGNTTFGGNTNNAFGNTNTSLFGSTSNPSQSLFGSTNTTTNTFGFGNNNSTANKPVGTVSAFGAVGGGFGSNTGNNNLFGSNPSNNANNNLFGAGNNAGNTFGNTSFGAANTSFGAGNTSFGLNTTNTTGNAPVGTTVKFNPTTGTDTMVKSGVNTNINTRHQCITCMKEYETKSLEELRCEDYLANRKGSTGNNNLFGQQQQQGNSFFNANSNSTQNMFNKGMFGATTANTPTTGFGGFNSSNANNNLFGSKQAGFGGFTNTATTSASSFSFGNNTTNTSLFGGANKPSSAFGQPQQQANSSLFGNTTATSAGTFGTPSQPSTGFGGFGGATSQPQQQSGLGLFGQNQTNKPISGFGNNTFGSTSNQPGFGPATATNAFGSTATSGAFGVSNNAFNKPTIGFGNANTAGFGSNPQTGNSASAGFGTNPVSSTFSFGNNAPALGNTAGGTFGNTGSLFGGSTATTSSTFGAQAKPGGLFGGGFGQANSNFGSNTMTINNPMMFKSPFGDANKPFGASTQPFVGNPQLNSSQFQGLQPQGALASSINNSPNPLIQQQLLQLATSPYGSNPLFRDVQQEHKKRDEPSFAQALKSKDESSKTSIILSPNRVVSAQRRPVANTKSLQQNRSAFFDGLDDSDIAETSFSAKKTDNNSNRNNGSDLFVPKSGSIKRLVLNSKKTPSGYGEENPQAAAASNAGKSGDHSGGDETLILNGPRPNLIPKKPDANAEDSFAVLNTKQNSLKNNKKESSRDIEKENNSSSKQQPSGNPNEQSDIKADTNNDDDSNEIMNCEKEALKPVFKLTRPDYYTIPAVNELLLDNEGRCLVEDFTICRQGYGNLFFPGLLDVSSLDLDAIVFILHKEVHVYPDEELKPPLGQGLNRKAQVTLDKVWPVDKTSREVIQSPQKLVKMNYQEMLERACRRLGARFVEYRPQTGSWVFKVDHFSKYGLEESDEEQENVVDNVNRRLLPQQPEKKASLSKPLQPLKKTVERKKNETLFKAAALFEHNSSSLSSVERENLNTIRASSLFAEDENEGSTVSDNSFKFDHRHKDAESRASRAVNLTKRRHVILERREPTTNASNDKRSESALLNSTVGNRSGMKGLGGLQEDVIYSTTKKSGNNLMNSILGDSFNLFEDPKSEEVNKSAPIYKGEESKRLLTEVDASKRDKSLLEEGYTTFTKLLMSKDTSNMSQKRCNKTEGTDKLVLERLLTKCSPFEKSLLRNFAPRVGLADKAAFMSRSFRVGWAHRGLNCSLLNVMDDLGVVRVNEMVLLDRSEAKIASLIEWLEVNLRHSSVVSESGFDNGDECEQPTLIQVDSGVETLEAHVTEATRQLEKVTETTPPSTIVFQKEMASIMTLCNALWGPLDDDTSCDRQRMMGEISVTKVSHSLSMARKRSFSHWLSGEIQSKTSKDSGISKMGDEGIAEGPFDSIFSLLSSNQLMEACMTARKTHNPYLSLLMTIHQEPRTRELLARQVQRWQEVNAHHFMHDSLLKIYAILSGEVQFLTSTDQLRNVAHNLDWMRALGLFLWYVTPIESGLSHAVKMYDEDLSRLNRRPVPDFKKDDHEVKEEMTRTSFDLKYQLLQLYCDRSHSLSSLLDTRTHSKDPLDISTSWLLLQCLEALGYQHLEQERRDSLHNSFGFQLEQLGLWKWAVYVYMHVSNLFARREAVVDVISRQNEELSETEINFLTLKLAVPQQWLNEAINIGLSNKATLVLKHKTAEQMLEAMDEDEDEELMSP